MNSQINKIRSLPLGALVVLIMMGGAFIVGASLVYVGLSVPADGTVIDTPVETAYFSSSVNPFHFGSLALANSSSVVTFTVTNISDMTRTLHVYGTNSTDAEVDLVVTLSNGTPYTPTSLTAGSSITLKAHLEATAEATPGPVTLIVRMD
jgi:hypothetical protein